MAFSGNIPLTKRRPSLAIVDSLTSHPGKYAQRRKLGYHIYILYIVYMVFLYLSFYITVLLLLYNIFFKVLFYN